QTGDIDTAGPLSMLVAAASALLSLGSSPANSARLKPSLLGCVLNPCRVSELRESARFRPSAGTIPRSPPRFCQWRDRSRSKYAGTPFYSYLQGDTGYSPAAPERPQN